MLVFRPCSAIAALSALLLVSCAETSGTTAPSAPGATDVQATTAGEPTCFPVSMEMNETGVRATNAARQRQGLAPLRVNTALAKAAGDHACDMARRGLMSHGGSTTTGPSQRVRANGYQPRIAAENIAAGPFGTERVLAEWSASQGHSANILIPQMRDFGLGRAIGADGKTAFWAAVYAAPR